jgi:hypothetical protein
VANIWKLAFVASLPAFMFGGCTCGSESQGCGSSQSCQPITCSLIQSCKTASDCMADLFEDINACNVAACVAGKCTTTPAPDGPASPQNQTPGDCATLVCQGGQQVQQPANDPPTVTNPCQMGACEGGSPVFPSVPDGTSCELKGVATALCVGGECLTLPGDVHGGGGGGGAGGAGGGGSDGGTVTGGTGGATGGGGAGGGPPGCTHCLEVLDGADPAMLCPSSKSSYDALASCICGATCGSACGASICQHQPAASACDDCIASVANGCGTQLTTCNDDP